MATEQNPSVLKKQRSIIKASCTRTKSYVDSIVSVTPQVLAQLEERKLKLELYWSEYNSVQSLLESLDDSEINDRGGFEEAFYTLASRIREILNPRLSSNSDAAPSSSTVGAQNSTGAVAHVRLPKLDIPIFSGRYDEWFPFHDVFNSIIHSNASLNNVQKLQYLRASLTGEASDVVSSLEISDLNYEVAWDLLKERYDNQRVIVHTHIKSIMELPSMTKENSSELRQIADGAYKHVRSLNALKRPTSHWDDLLVYIISSKLDALSLREWQSSLIGAELPTLKQLIDFITHRYQVIEATNKSNTIPVKSVYPKTQQNLKRQAACATTIKFKCSYCKGEHSVYHCKDFLALPVPRRVAEIRGRKICTNCLRSSAHTASKCTSGSCKNCKMKHNTLLHIVNAPESREREAEERAESASMASPAALVAHMSRSYERQHVMLSTAVVYAYDDKGSPKLCRALLDCGSQANFVSKNFLTVLGLKPRSLNVSISGINNATTRSTRIVQLKLQSRLNSYSAVIDCIVTDQVTDKLPAFTLKRSTFDLPRNLELADPRFHESSEVDVLIGAELFWDLICVGQVASSSRHPVLQKTRLGWILAGRLSNLSNSTRKMQSFHTTITNVQLHDQLSLFWQQERLADKSNPFTIEEARCEQHFINNVSRTRQGKYTVKLPFKEGLTTQLGDSKDTAMKRLQGLEKRFRRDPTLKGHYVRFMDEYLLLGHMRKVNVNPNEDSASFYLPHHPVTKNSGQSLKLRVVFDASCATTSGLSLNDTLMVGPVVQQDLMSILMRFRTFLFVITADIVKMYRQVLVDPSHTRFQRILWRNDINSEVQTYELTTLTYGTSSASYLATRCLKHIAEQHESEYPIGSKRIKRDFYVDDLLTGADSFDEAKQIRDEIIELLRLGSFELSKWASNCPELLGNSGHRNNTLITINDDSNSRILGIHWNQSDDVFHFSYENQNSYGAISKRTILSEIARLFDPLGLIGPVIVIAKLILQELWQTGIHWDESVPQAIHSRWLGLQMQLRDLDRIQISRCVKFATEPGLVQIHGFCDASQCAFEACVYIRSKIGINEYRTELLCSRSRVAPLKTISLPRLELSAALLLAQLVEKVSTSFSLSDMRMFLWSDSTITLNWVTSPSKKWSTYVANRVGEIQRLTEIENWRHVSSSNNPADILSRGLHPCNLINASLWWHGPTFLKDDENQWPTGEFVRLKDDIPEMRGVSTAVATLNHSVVDELLGRRSDLNKVYRIIAYCLRLRKIHRPKEPTVFVSHSEITYARGAACKAVQRSAFPEEYRALNKGKSVNTSSKLLSLSPFMNESELIRVGGRLEKSELQYEARHPILLPRDHELTRRIIAYEHVRNLHSGTLATVAFVRQRFWPLSLRSTTRKIIRACVTCFKINPSYSEAIMGSLPKGRVSISRPFSHCGVDYAGPMMLREGKRRNACNHKAYMSIFVCFATKGVHIELVSDLTTDAFLGAFRRFMSRRGKPVCMYSDNETNFVGANRQLRELYEFINAEQVQNSVKEFFREHETSWVFIPPNAPHFGGLWEAAVKSSKHHISRVAGKAHLTFEEMQTVLCEIEAILNSRPLTQLSSDPNDFSYLSPAHFLVGTTLNSFPCPDLHDINENRLTRWQVVEQIRQHFWRRWSVEYLHSLQERSKWKVNKGAQLKAGQLVLVRQQGLAPMQWLLGRVQDVNPSSDGIARIATVRTSKGLFTRPLSKLAILPEGV